MFWLGVAVGALLFEACVFQLGFRLGRMDVPLLFPDRDGHL